MGDGRRAGAIPADGRPAQRRRPSRLLSSNDGLVNRLAAFCRLEVTPAANVKATDDGGAGKCWPTVAEGREEAFAVIR
jgi:hypothetical protein